MSTKVKKVKKKIRRKRGSGPRNMYFTKDTQASIEKYQQTEDQNERNKIYVEEVRNAFEKLCENLIYVYGFKSPYDSFIELKNDCVSFLVESLDKWDPARGTKAFSYFNVVAKNWLIIRSRKQRKRMIRHVCIDNPDSMTAGQRTILEEKHTTPGPEAQMMKAQSRIEIIKMLDSLYNRAKNDAERRCVSAIKTVFLDIDELDFLNKRAVLVYVRDISGLTPKQLSVAMSSIRKYYKELRKGDLFDIF